jgi:ribosomal protein L11 methyltransferase
MTDAGHILANSSVDSWIELSVRLPLVDAELVSDVMGALAEGGVSMESGVRTFDDRTFSYQIDSDSTLVCAFFPAPLSDRTRRMLRKRLEALPLSQSLPRLRYRATEAIDWAQAWKKHFTTLHVGRLTVRPSWEQVNASERELSIVLDPGQAFGTGQHPTTRLCLEAIERELVPGACVLDIGCGSGILALAAARLGAKRVDALDTELEAVAVARENVRRNRLGSRIRVAAGSLGADWPRTDWGEVVRGYDCVLANISSAIVLQLLPGVVKVLRQGGLFVASGFMVERVSELFNGARASGLSVVRLEQDGEWCAFVAKFSN